MTKPKTRTIPYVHCESRIPAESFTGTKWQIRAGGSDHEQLGSRTGDRVEPWKPPAIISCRELQVLGVYGGKAAV